MMTFVLGVIVGFGIYDLWVTFYIDSKKQELIKTFEIAVENNDLRLSKEDVLKFVEQLKK